MSRWIFLCLLFGFAAGQHVWAQDDPDLLKALALQKTMQKVIQQAEPAIACILVSRSECYQEIGQGPDKTHPGKLGSFDLQAFKSHRDYLKLTAEERLQKLKKFDLADPGYVPRSFGSGVVVDTEGLILTNYHVVQEATKLYVRQPGGKGSYADIHAADPRSDLAVLKLLNPNILPLQALSFGDAGKIERGHFVLTLANPFAVGFRDGQPSASWGILSNIRRRSLSHLREEERIKPLHFYGTLLQTDARLHLGCSGGALLNLHGEMIGLLTSFAAIQGGETPGGFAIPVNAGMRRIIDVLKRGEEVDYGFLGIGFDERATPGVTLSQVLPGSPADLEGKLKEGDALLAVDGQPLHDTDDIYTTIGSHLAGIKVKLRVRNGVHERVAEVTLAKLYVPGKKIVSSLGSRPFVRGLRIDYTSLLAQQPPRLALVPPGVLVTEIQAGTSAERANLKAGDIISHVNQQAVNTPAAFYQAVAEARGPIELTLYAFQQPGTPPTKNLIILLK